jgi:hypothetical protein
MEHQEVQEHQEVVEVLDLQVLTGANGTSEVVDCGNIREVQDQWKRRISGSVEVQEHCADQVV